MIAQAPQHEIDDLMWWVIAICLVLLLILTVAYGIAWMDEQRREVRRSKETPE